MPSRQVHAGSTLVWLFLWIVGLAAIAYWCASQHVPAIQRQIQLNAEEAVSFASASDVVTSVQGRTVTLKGSVVDDTKKTELLSALNDADGVRHVNDDQLIVINSVAAVTKPEGTSSDTLASNEQQSQNTGVEEVPSNAPETTSAKTPASAEQTPETPAAEAPSSEAPAPAPPPAPEAPSSEAPTPFSGSTFFRISGTRASSGSGTTSFSRSATN